MDGLAAYRMAIREAVDRFGGFILHHLGDGVIVCFGYPIGNEDRGGAGGARRARDRRRGRQAHRGVGGAARARRRRDRRHREPGQPGDRPHRGQFHRRRAQHRGPPPGRGRARVRSSWRSRPRVLRTASSSPVRSGRRRSRASPIRSRLSSSPASARRAPVSRDASKSPTRRSSTATPSASLLLKLFGEAALGSGRTIYIVGEPGIGKSRLAHVLGEIAGDAEFRQFGLQCNAALANTALHPHIDLLQETVRHRSGGRRWRETWKAQGLSRLDGARRTPRRWRLPRACSSIDSPDAPPVAMPPPEQRARTLATLHELLLIEAREAPLVLVYEDLHWADPTSRDLVAQLVDASREARAAADRDRPARRAAGMDCGATMSPRSISTASAPRTPPVSPRRSASSAGLSRIDIDRIVKRTDGVPLFVEEMTRMMLDAPDRARRADLPESLSDLLTERLDRLGAARRYMQVGAIIGREFSPALLAAVVDEPVGELREPLADAARLGARASGRRRRARLQARADPGRSLCLDPRPAAARTARARRRMPDYELRRDWRARAGNGRPPSDGGGEAARGGRLVAEGGRRRDRPRQPAGGRCGAAGGARRARRPAGRRERVAARNWDCSRCSAPRTW